MSDIFISYSRRDQDQALSLVDRLQGEGLDVWIDRHGIEGAQSWSKEVANALESCSQFVLLLSHASVASINVAKELAVATTLNKRIIPIRCDQVALSGEFLYHLASLQYVEYADFDALVQVLTGKQTERKLATRPLDDRKTLMILPFEDLSPTRDNEWFADGIVSELISTLSSIRALRVADATMSKEFKEYNGHLTDYAREMSIQYFVQGDVRKFGDNIKISARLLDISTGDHLWQDSLRGEMKDIFDIQEDVAKKVTEGLRVILSSDEKEQLRKRGTESVEAYEFMLKSFEYFQRNTREGFEHAARTASEAIALDPNYAMAYVQRATALANLYREYDHNPQFLEEGLQLIEKSRRLRPDILSMDSTFSAILQLQGKLEEAEQVVRGYLERAPNEFMSQFAMGFYYFSTNQHAKAIAPFEEALKIKPENLTALWNLALSCFIANERSKQKQWAMTAIPKFEKHLKLFPGDERKQVQLSALLFAAGRDEEARTAAKSLLTLRDGSTLHTAAALHCVLRDYEAGVMLFRKAIEAGFRNFRDLKLFLVSPDRGIASLKDTPEWESTRILVEKVIAEEEKKRNG